MSNVLSSPLFGIVLCILAYEAGVYANHKLKTPVANPLIIATIVVIAVLKLFQIDYADFEQGGNIINMLLAPATASLAVPIYKNLAVLKKNLLPVLLGAGVGSFTAVGSIYLMCKWFGLDKALTAALLPKSVTMPIALELCAQNGGLAPITVAAVVFTGIGGAMFAPHLIKLFGFKNDIASGLAIGTSSHAAGTSKAVEMGETIGAMSGIAIGIAGLFTVLFVLLFRL